MRRMEGSSAVAHAFELLDLERADKFGKARQDYAAVYQGSPLACYGSTDIVLRLRRAQRNSSQMILKPKGSR